MRLDVVYGPPFESEGIRTIDRKSLVFEYEIQPGVDVVELEHDGQTYVHKYMGPYSLHMSFTIEVINYTIGRTLLAIWLGQYPGPDDGQLLENLPDIIRELIRQCCYAERFETIQELIDAYNKDFSDL